MFRYPEAFAEFGAKCSGAYIHPDCPTIHSYPCHHESGRGVPSFWRNFQILTASCQMFLRQYLLFPSLLFYLFIFLFSTKVKESNYHIPISGVILHLMTIYYIAKFIYPVIFPSFRREVKQKNSNIYGSEMKW